MKGWKGKRNYSCIYGLGLRISVSRVVGRERRSGNMGSIVAGYSGFALGIPSSISS